MPDDGQYVRLYGLIPVTCRRYRIQSAIEIIGLVALLAAWFWGWPTLQKRLAPFELPWAMAVVMAILARIPWLVFGLAVFKAVELHFMLRAFRRKAATATSGSLSDGQAPLAPLSGSGPGRQGPDS